MTSEPYWYEQICADMEWNHGSTPKAEEKDQLRNLLGSLRQAGLSEMSWTRGATHHSIINTFTEWEAELREHRYTLEHYAGPYAKE